MIGRLGAWELEGKSLPVLHRGLLGIAFKEEVTHRRLGGARAQRRIAALRHALLADDYRNVFAPFSFRFVLESDGSEVGDDRVVFGGTPDSSRFTIGSRHWVVPLNRRSGNTEALAWTVIDRPVSDDDVERQLWVEGKDLDPGEIVKRLPGLAGQVSGE